MGKALDDNTKAATMEDVQSAQPTELTEDDSPVSATPETATAEEMVAANMASEDTSELTSDKIEDTLEEITRSVEDVKELIRDEIPSPISAPADESTPEEVDQQNSDILQSTELTPEQSEEPKGLEELEEMNEIGESEAPPSVPAASAVVETEPPVQAKIHEPVVRTPPARPGSRGGEKYSPVLVAYHDRGGKVTEEYRSLRTSLLARCPEDRFCFLVTSAERGEGKTVSCLNLAMVMAERVDCRTVVVDLDLRSGCMADLLGVPAGPGMADCLRGAASLSDVIQPTAYPNLSFIPAGKMDHYHAGELLGRGELKKTVAQLRRDFDFVLLDTPAVNEFSDAGVTGLAAGEALLVVRTGKTPKESVSQAIHALQNANVNLVGILMTHWRSRFFS